MLRRVSHLKISITTQSLAVGVVNNFTYVENKDDPSKNDWNYEKKDPMKSGMSN